MQQFMYGLVVAATCGIVSSHAADEFKQPIEFIKDSWRKRQESIENLKVGWSEARIQPKGYLDRLTGMKKEQEPNPPSDLKLTGKIELTFDKERLITKVVRDHWSVKHKKVMETEQFGLFEGGINTSLTTKSTIVDRPDAEIIKSAKSSNAMEYGFLPIAMYCRGMNTIFSVVNLDDYKLTGRKEQIDGITCVELVRQTDVDSNSDKKVILLDPANDFIPIRYYHTRNEQTIVLLDIKYLKTESKIRPVSWKYVVSSSKGVPLETMQIQCDTWNENTTLAKEVFQHKLPAGTFVYDATGAETMRYVILKDGNVSASVPDSKHIPYDQLSKMPQVILKDGGVSASVPDSQHIPDDQLPKMPHPLTGRQFLYTSLAISALVCFTTLFMLWRRLRRSKASGN